MPGQKEVLWNSGENVGNLDLNNMQRFARAVAADWMFAHLGQFNGFDAASAVPSVAILNRIKYLWCMGDSAAPYASGTSRRIDSLGGPIVQWIAASPTSVNSARPSDWGLEPYALVYWLAPNELQTTHDIGDASARWDTVSIGLASVSNDLADQETRLQKQVVGSAFVISSNGFIKRRKVTLTKTVTKGTPGSSIPPAIPADHVAVYSVYVPALHNAVFDPEALWDFRMPLGSFCVDVLVRDVAARLSGINLGSVTNLDGAWGGIQAGSATAHLYIPSHSHNAHSARLVGVEALIGSNNATAAFNLIRIDSSSYGSLSSGGAISRAPGLALGALALGGIFGNPGAPATEFRASIDDGVSGLRMEYNAGGGAPSVPVWINGCASGYASRSELNAVGTDNTLKRLGLEWFPGDVNGKLCMVRFHYAGGI